MKYEYAFSQLTDLVSYENLYHKIVVSPICEIFLRMTKIAQYQRFVSELFVKLFWIAFHLIHFVLRGFNLTVGATTSNAGKPGLNQNNLEMIPRISCPGTT